MREPTFTDQVSAWSELAGATFSFLVLLIAFATWRTAREALRASRDANIQTKRDSIEQTRPYVYAEVVPSLAGSPNWDVRVANVGKSAALDLRLDFSDWPEPPDDVAQSVRTLFTTRRTLAPGSSIRAMWRLESGPDSRFEDGSVEAGLGKSGTITLAYRSSDPEAPTYSDHFQVMIDDSGLWPIPEAGPSGSRLSGEKLAFYRLGQSIARAIGEQRR
ncbi:hypothetical protein [Aeromicrobium sp. 50.2.37]|uniref:hypothetical protein n=1 Tax=Aeromicrobium sp. 50.2.37 TaxID=2969305 RepID=UPI00215006FA|nr:hypothetical protein [Aeromicrobium sp. 50.2.37]MCR4512669.1 hypothetical protein [Aeromicrobium sp. 50.2.37]